MPIIQKNPSPLLVDKVRGFYDLLPDWVKTVIPIRIEKQKIDAKTAELDDITGARVSSELKQEVTDEKLKTNRYIDSGTGNGELPPGFWPLSHPSEMVLPDTGQVADVTEVVSDQPLTMKPAGPPLQQGTVEQIGALWHSKEVNAPTFDKGVYQKAVDDLMPAEFRAAIPKNTEQHTVDGIAVTPTLSSDDLLRREEQDKVGVKKTTREWRVDSTPATLYGKRIEPDFNGATTTLQKDIIPQSTAITQVFGITDIKTTPFDDQNAVRELWSTGVFPELVQYNYDPEMDTRVRTLVQVRPAAEVFTPTAGVLDYNERKMDAVHKLRVTNNVDALPATQVLYETKPFSFPSLLVNLEFRIAALGTAGRSEVQWTAGVRAGFTVPVRFQINTTYSWVALFPIAAYYWAPGDVMFKGVSYSISLNNLLFDTWTNIGVSYTADTKYGNLVDRFNITQTSPNASTYSSQIGQLACISSDVTRYKRLWKRQDRYITLL